MILDTIAIQAILPHRYPFLMVDSIIEMERLKRIVGIKNVTITEYFFQGHFPGKPIMPGVLILESLAQAGGVLLLNRFPTVKASCSILSLSMARASGARWCPAISSVWKSPRLPGVETFCKMQGRATVDGELAAEATLMCKMVDREMVVTAAAATPATASASAEAVKS